MPSTEPITYELAKFVAETKYTDLPEKITAKMKLYLLDSIASGFVGSQLSWAKIVLEMVNEQGGNPQSSVFGQADKVTSSQAALVNGTMIGGFESEHLGHTSHPGGTVPPAALAIAEREKVTGKDFLLAMAMGYETVTRIGDAQGRDVEVIRGFHNPCVNGPFSAAAAVGKMFGFDAATQAAAFGIAGSYASGLAEYAWKGEMTKRMHLGHASQGGLEAATLAKKGFTGPATILEGEFGYFNAFSPKPQIDLVLSGLGEEWRLETLTIKAYPAHNSSQAIIAAIQQLKADNEIDPTTITKVHLKASHHLEPRYLNAAPDSHMGAQYSTLFNMAVAIYRDLDRPASYDESTLTDKNILAMAQLITYEDRPGEHGTEDEIEVVAGGTTYTVTTGPFRGSLKNPCTFEDVKDKFRRYSEHVLTNDAQDKIIETVANLDQLQDFSDVAPALRNQ